MFNAPNVFTRLGTRIILSKRLQSSSSPPKSFSDKIRNTIDKAKEDASRIAVEVTEAGKNRTRDAIRRSSDEVKKMTNKATIETANFARQALESSKNSANLSIESSKKIASQTLRSSQVAASQVVSTAAKSASRVASEGSQHLSKEVSNTRDSALRWFFWWSLSAVAVYGLVTTIPKELIRVYFEKDDNKNNEISPKKQEPIDGDSNRNHSVPSVLRSLGFAGNATTKEEELSKENNKVEDGNRLQSLILSIMDKWK